MASEPADRADRPNLWALTFSIPALVFLAALLFGCATPEPAYRLRPSSKDVVWISGRAALVQEHNGIRVATAFEEQHGKTLGMRVEIQNSTEERLEVGPQKIWYSACSAMAVESCTTSQKVVDPEVVLAAIEEKQSVDRAEAANSQAAMGALVLLSVASDVATVASGKGDRNTGLGTMASVNMMDSDAARRGSGMANLQSQRQMWSNEALRRNSLFPGQGTGGSVFVPILPEANYVWLQLRVGNERFAFHFEQVVRKFDRQTGYSTTRADNR